jgi:protein-tyrosine phosphatase
MGRSILSRKSRMAYRVLFVCTGNICRSPTAEAVFLHRAAAAGMGCEIEADSVGIGDWHVGDPPDARSIAAAARRGLDLSTQCARQVSLDDFNRFDLLVAMDRGHARALEGLRPAGAGATVRRFLEFAPELALDDVPDPYYGGIDGFERVLDMVEAAADGLVAAISAGRV